ncbi:MAG: outer membrane beta-barrel protein [Planctomycetota bacterium]|jgi:opacity protein-like surface antigen
MKRIFILLSALIIFFTSPVLSARKSGAISYGASIGIGTGIPVNPAEFEDNYDPSFGGILDFQAHWKWFAASASIDYNFFIANGLEPNDANILTAFLNARVSPTTKGSLRPYLLVGGGLFRYWIVDLQFSENTTGWQFGLGVDIEISRSQTLFIDAKYVEGRTRETNADAANTVFVPIRLGLTFHF